MDFNNDGRADINVVHSDWNRKESFVFLSDADSIRLYPQIFIPLPGGAQWFWASRPSHSAGDINGDGYPDFAIRVGLAQLIYYQGSNRGFERFIMATSQHGFSDQYGTQLALVGDQNGDEVRDIATNIAFEDGTPSRVIVLGGNRNLPVGLETIDNLPWNANLSAYPNPFWSQTTLHFDIDRTGIVTIRIVDVLGRKVRLLREGWMHAGEQWIAWDGMDDNGQPVPPGVYFYQVNTQQSVMTGSVIFVRKER